MVIAVASYTHQLIIPLFLGMLTWGKVWVKSLTPKLSLLLMKNGVVIQARRLLVQASTHILVKSHRPWRRGISSIRLTLVGIFKNSFARYFGFPLWLRTILALLLLLATAGSSFAVFALLVIPQPVLNWLRQKVLGMLNKMGARTPPGTNCQAPASECYAAIYRTTGITDPTGGERCHGA